MSKRAKHFWRKFRRIRDIILDRISQEGKDLLLDYLKDNVLTVTKKFSVNDADVEVRFVMENREQELEWFMQITADEDVKIRYL